MATLVTGGSGFIGLAIAEQLIAASQRVVLFDLAAPAADLLSRPELSGALVINGDVRSADDVDHALKVAGIDHIIHAAAITPSPQRECDEARRIVDVNISGAVNVLERAVKVSSVKRFVMLSSVAVYGFSKPAASGLFEEDLSPPAPAALYGITKLAAEQAALRIGDLHGMDVRVARLGPVFGAWENYTAVRDALSPHYQILAFAREGREVILPRAMAGDWIYSRDAAAGIVAVSECTSLKHRIYHVGGGAITDLVQWCQIVAAHLPGFRWSLRDDGMPGNIIYGLPRDRAALNTARLNDDTGFLAGRDLAAAAHDYLGWLAIATSR